MNELFEDNYQVFNTWENKKVMRYYGSLDNCRKYIAKYKAVSPEVNYQLEEYNYMDWHGKSIIAEGQIKGEIK